ncbi:MAG: glycosyltransferase family 2 protein [Archaeoglobus sp.]|uniref:glycosyltransferase n=1 Tax=Archaeoglobus sp. TaxID=1872626 RepID=UPI001E05B93D|nr:glycosyltransferase family 2 protein [Archaeoglobus sp.]MBO8179151.1 glycosyltransferase family 2 protein [Archaeoglobus sp.]
MKLAVVVPVSPFEDEEIIRRSIEHLKSLDYDDFDVKLVYVIDSNGENDRRPETAIRLGVEVVFRENRRGKRAGAINDALKYLSDFKPDYVAIFDVDSRPEMNFIVECVKALESCEDCYIASTKRYISNPINLVSETVEAEYYLINFLLGKSKFRQFNGLIGVLRAEFLMQEGLNEWAVAEDADFATRMHAKGRKAVLVKTSRIYEQAPITWKDLYNQRKRWYYGGLQLWRYRKEMRKASLGVRLSWYMALTLTFVPMLYLPLLLLSPFFLLAHFRKISKVKVTFGLFIHALMLQYAAVKALFSFVRKREVEWGAMQRVVD